MLLIAQCVVAPIAGNSEIATGLWEIGAVEGTVFGVNMGLLDCDVRPGQTIGVLEPAFVQTRVHKMRLYGYRRVAS